MAVVAISNTHAPTPIIDVPGQIPFVDDEERLVIEKFREYNHLLRPTNPTANHTIAPIVIQFGLAMVLLINVDEKNQIMQTNVWLTLRWHDESLSWNPADYGDIRQIRVPPDKVWLPDIVLFNNADGNYEVSFHSNVVIESTGDLLWVPPALFKSSCRIDVENFPFDEQVCILIFGSWTYDAHELQLAWYNAKSYIDLADYSYSGIWDVMDVPGQLIADASKVEFRIVLRRKPLFYTVILIIPTVLMAFLSMMVFYLPAECSEKITLAISILLALVVFLLLVSKILPPTSDTIPLMAKYLLMTFVMNIITILVTVIIINIHFRSSATNAMPSIIRSLFLRILPRLLFMQRPERIPIFNGYFVEEYNACDLFDASLVIPSMAATLVPFMRTLEKMQPHRSPHHPNCRVSRPKTSKQPSGDGAINRETSIMTEGIALIAEHMKEEVEDKKIREDWKFAAMVIDRLLLLLFFGVTLGGTIGIIFSAPHVFDYVNQERVIAKLNARNLYSQ